MTNNELVTAARSSLLGPFDVACERGGLNTTHCANKRFRILVAYRKQEYSETINPADRKLIHMKLLEELDYHGYKFVVWDRSNERWVSAPPKKVRRKISQALREGIPRVRPVVLPPVLPVVLPPLLDSFDLEDFEGKQDPKVVGFANSLLAEGFGL